MDNPVDELPVDHNLKCHICGENQFEEREGFYYCQECGTKQEQVCLIEVERDDEFDQEKLKTKKQKIHVAKAENPQLTSWECYNYILRGFVEELLSYGAKEGLKLMTLQVWAAYLRRMQVAFFNRKQPDLPKLGIRYLPIDAQTIYNRTKKHRKRRQRRPSEDTSCTSGGHSGRSFRRSKRKLDESNYSLTSATSTSGGSALTSSTSVNSNRAIKIGFSTKARAYFKRKMSVKHLSKHEVDSECLLTCHKQPKAREINRTDYNLMLVNIKQICSIVAIALNLIGDEIQLSDFVRFIHEGHIDISNVLQYFPENIANHGKEILKNINFYQSPTKYADKALRDQIGMLCKNIGIHAPQKPDIIKLVRRYTSELCLPTNFADYIERLINFLPPQFETRVAGQYPGFEARAMAYIIFTLKLFFGLDDKKEYLISRASQNLNSKIQLLNRRKQEKQPLLFVWNEWVEYIEMRKIIVSQFNTSFCEQFKQCQSTNQLLEQMVEEIRRTEECDNLHNDTSANLHNKQKFESFRSLFECFKETYIDSEKDKQTPLKIEFKPSLTPAHSYLKTVLLFCENEANTSSSMHIKIPNFMRIDHSQRDINSYLQVKPLITFFRSHKLKLNIHVLPTTENKQYVGIFRTPRSNRKNYKLQKPCFEVTEKQWSQTVTDGITQTTDDLEFITDLKTYSGPYDVLRKRISKRVTYFNPDMDYDITTILNDTHNNGNEKAPKRNPSQNHLSPDSNKSTSIKKDNLDLQSMHSFELFSENNMEPIDSPDFITKPRRNLENIDLFAEISDEESVLNDDDGDDANVSDNSEPIILNGDDFASPLQEFETSFDSIPSIPSTLEEYVKIEPASPNSAGGNKNKSCKSNDALKMYISNMDYWMMLGSIIMMTKAQKTQLQNAFPRSFNWLLETCAQTINVEWAAVFEQLLCIETMFCLGINDPKTIKNCVYIYSQNHIKEIQTILRTYQQIW